MSTTKQDGPSTGLVAAAVLFVAFAAKDLFSETTPGDLIDTSVAKGASGATDGEVVFLYCYS